MTKILIVDDERAVVTALCRALETTGYELLTASSGSEGVTVFSEHHPDAVITDYRMAHGTGDHLLRHVSQVKPDTVRFMLTGQADLAVVKEIIRDGCVDRFFLKPWDDDSMIEVLQQLLAEQGVRRQLFADWS